MLNKYLLWAALCCPMLTMAQSKPAHSYLSCTTGMNIDQLEIAIGAIRQGPYDEIRTLDNDQPLVADARLPRFQELFEGCIDSQQHQLPLDKLDTASLKRHFAALQTVNFYFNHPSITQTLATLLERLDENGAATEQHIEQLHQAYVRNRQSERAEALRLAHPRLPLEKVPLIDSSYPPEKGVLTPGTSGQGLTLDEFHYPVGGFILVIGSPQCQFSNRFFAWLNQAENRQLKTQLAQHSLVMTPADASLYLEELSSLNRRISPLSMKLTYREEQWPEIPLWSTPAFYFFRDGKLKGQMLGWPEEGRPDALSEMMTLIDL